MHSSSKHLTVSQTCIIFTLTITCEASRFLHNPASITAPPAAATMRARDSIDETVPGACSPFDRYVQARPGATCEGLASDNGISMDELLLMNPDINAGCTNLMVGSSYCVGAIGSEAHPAPVLSCSVTNDVQDLDICTCNNGKYYGLMASPGAGGPCDWLGQALPPTLASPTSIPPSTTYHVPLTTITVPPSPIVWNSYCTTTPSTCLSGATGTDNVAYTTGCCNGCGPGGSCDLDGPAKGSMSYVCNCGGEYRRRAFNGLIENGTWVA